MTSLTFPAEIFAGLLIEPSPPPRCRLGLYPVAMFRPFLHTVAHQHGLSGFEEAVDARTRMPGCSFCMSRSARAHVQMGAAIDKERSTPRAPAFIVRSCR